MPGETPQEPYDVIVIGGGVVGSWVACDAAQRGLRVALFEQGDLASGTSSRTSKLIHGGLRYLEQGAFRLVAEGTRERAVWLRIAPHLVRPLPFLFPLYRGAGRSPWMVRLGMTLYDVLSWYRNVEPHRMLSAAEAKRLEPSLRDATLVGAARFFDAQMDDARACLEVGLCAAAAGARIETGARVDGLLRRDGRVIGVRVGTREVFARVVVNAAGPWLDRVSAMADGPAARIRMTRGAHLVLPPLLREHALVLAARRDGRVFFVIPWRGYSLVGTTDVDYSGDPSAVVCSDEERRYLLDETRKALPGSVIPDADVLAEFAGVRPLAYESGGTASAVSREDLVAEDPNGVIAIAGGKFTTARAVAERAVTRVAARIGRTDLSPCRTATAPLVGGHPVPTDQAHAWRARALSLGLSDAQADALSAMYGSRFGSLLDLAARHGTGGRLHPDLPWVGVQVDFAVQHEMARTVEDVLRRRLPIALGPHRFNRVVTRLVAERMGALLGWDAEAREGYVTRYLAA
ncbi:MAG: glycerol-3-phosphate dehydrogenase/oxidase [Nitrospirota bacterium]